MQYLIDYAISDNAYGGDSTVVHTNYCVWADNAIEAIERACLRLNRPIEDVIIHKVLRH